MKYTVKEDYITIKLPSPYGNLTGNSFAMRFLVQAIQELYIYRRDNGYESYDEDGYIPKEMMLAIKKGMKEHFSTDTYTGIPVSDWIRQ